MTSPSTLPGAGLSLDLDNLWSYLRAYGDPRWQQYPSFLDRAVPRILAAFAALDIKATIFVVGRDAADPAHARLMEALVAGGHELANHSFDHDPNFSRFDRDALERDFELSESAIRAFSVQGAQGFRAPAFGQSAAALATLARRGYRYDSSLFPSSTGPLARTWERLRYRRGADGKDTYAETYGNFAAARGPLGMFRWDGQYNNLAELPVTTMPYSRLPVHWTYLNFIATPSLALGRAYLALHIALARRTGVQPQLLLHSTDFIGSDDPEVPRFMPGMRRTAAEKIEFVLETLRMYRRYWALAPLADFVTERLDDPALPVLSPTRFFPRR